MHDLLHEPLISIRTPAGAARVSLPELLERLCQGAVDAYMGVRPHQADSFQVLLVQLAANVVERKGGIAARDVAYWRDGLLDLAEGEASAWQLVEMDATKPAFLQHRLQTAGELASFKEKAAAPDELDVLVTSKDHDVKMARALSNDAELWLYALILHQTTSGVLGAGNYGVVRMNGGHGSRPVVSTVSSLHPAQRFLEELDALCALRPATISRYNFRDRGVVLTWLAPWNRDTHQHMLTDLEPWFIEAARPVRLVHRAEHICALASTSKARQIGPKSLENGDVGDPWIPVNVADTKKGRSALTLSEGGWTPERVSKLLFQQGFELTALQKPRAGMGDAWMTFSAIVRGQGTTDGFHSFALRIPAPVRRMLLSRGSADSLGEFSTELLKDARECAKAVGLALTALAEGGPENPSLKNDTVIRWSQGARESLNRTWQDEFFPTLWLAVDERKRPELRESWRQRLVDAAETAFRQADQSLPLPAARRYRALVRAEGLLRRSLRKAGLLPEFTPVLQEEITDD